MSSLQNKAATVVGQPSQVGPILVDKNDHLHLPLASRQFANAVPTELPTSTNTAAENLLLPLSGRSVLCVLGRFAAKIAHLEEVTSEADAGDQANLPCRLPVLRRLREFACLGELAGCCDAPRPN